MQEALMKSQKEEEEKAKAAQDKLRRSMEITKENRELQIMSLQEKLREHVSVCFIVREVFSLYSVLIVCKWVDCCLFGVPVVEKKINFHSHSYEILDVM